MADRITSIREKIDFDSVDKKVIKKNIAMIDSMIESIETEIEFIKLGADEESLSELVTSDKYNAKN